MELTFNITDSKYITSLTKQLKRNPDDVALQHRLLEARLERSIELGLRVSPEDASVLYEYTWHLSTDGYAMTHTDGKTTSLHKLIHSRRSGTSLSDYKRQDHVRHVERAPLNCRRDNIHEKTGAARNQRELNRKLPCNNTSGVANANWNKTTKRWHVQFKVKIKVQYFGYYRDINEAAFIADGLRPLYFQAADDELTRDETLALMFTKRDELKAAWAALTPAEVETIQANRVA